MQLPERELHIRPFGKICDTGINYSCVMSIDSETWSAIAAIGSAAAAGISALSLLASNRQFKRAGISVRTIREMENGKPRSYFCVQNLGPAIARDIEVSIADFSAPEDVNLLDFSPDGLLRIPYLAPGSEIRRPIHLVMGTDVTKLISGHISWLDLRHREVEFSVPRMQ